jgi:phage terminase large subunit
VERVRLNYSVKPAASPHAEEAKIQATRIFFENYNSEAKEIVNRGGAGSSKSYSLAQMFCQKLLTEKNKRILIIRKSLPSLRISVYQTMKEVLGTFKATKLVKEEKVGMNWYYDTNYIHFGSVDDPEKLKCFHPDTELLTKTGFKNIKDVKVGELIASVDPCTRKLEYKPVSNIYSYDYKGMMYTNSHSKTSPRFCVTPEHKLLILNSKGRLEFVQAKDYRGQKFARHIYQTEKGIIIDKFEVPHTNGKKPTIFPIVPFLKFLGWYLSEGSADNKGTITIAQSKVEGKREFLEDTKDFPIKFNYCKFSNAFKASSVDLARYLLQFGKSGSKFIPREILDLDSSLLKFLFETLVKGDGRAVLSVYVKKIVYTTISEKLKDNVMELAFKLGYAVGATKSKTPKGEPVWQIRCIYNRDAGSKQVNKIKYKGPVYCVEVPPFHTLVTRFSQVIEITGNSSDWNYIWMEEATDFTEEEFKIIRLRLRAPSIDGKRNQVFLSFNPIDEFHWIKTNLVDAALRGERQGVQEIVSTYQDNPFLPEDYVEELKRLGLQDINHYRIYTLGEWGRMEHLIYTNWDIVQSFPEDYQKFKVVYGLDFGFNAPSALVRVWMKGNECWEEQLIYKKGLTNKDLIQQMELVIPPEHKRRVPIYADSAQPDKIIEIQNAGFKMCKLAQKNISDGIDAVKRMKCHVLASSDDLIKEKRAYSYRVDKKTGNLTDDPIDFMNHLMDAERYAIHTYLKGSREVKILWLGR